MKFRKKPVIIEAVLYNGGAGSNREIIDWTKGSSTPAYLDEHPKLGPLLYINTLEGSMWVHPGDYVIKGAYGEFYPCNAVIFAGTYEKVEECVSR